MYKTKAKTKYVYEFENLPGSGDEHLLRLSVQQEILVMLASSSSWLQFSVLRRACLINNKRHAKLTMLRLQTLTNFVIETEVICGIG